MPFTWKIFTLHLLAKYTLQKLLPPSQFHATPPGHGLWFTPIVFESFSITFIHIFLEGLRGLLLVGFQDITASTMLYSFPLITCPNYCILWFILFLLSKMASLRSAMLVDGYASLPYCQCFNIFYLKNFWQSKGRLSAISIRTSISRDLSFIVFQHTSRY